MIRSLLMVAMLSATAFGANTNKVEHVHEWMDGCIVASATPEGECLAIHPYPRRTCKSCWREEESIGKEWKQITHEEIVSKVEKERKAEHTTNKIIIKERDKGSKKESDWETAKEYPLMFNNNKKAKKAK